MDLRCAGYLKLEALTTDIPEDNAIDAVCQPLHGLNSACSRLLFAVRFLAME